MKKYTVAYDPTRVNCAANGKHSTCNYSTFTEYRIYYTTVATKRIAKNIARTLSDN